MFTHERLAVYHNAVAAAVALRLLADRLPDRCGDIRDQLRRACCSIPFNIAEGAAEYSPGEKIRFYRFARRSVAECAAVLDVLEGVYQMDVDQLRSDLSEVSAMLMRLIQSQPASR